MDDYPRSFVARPRPLVALSGFEAGHSSAKVEHERLFRYGPRIASGSALVGGEYAGRLLREFLAFDPGDRPVDANLKPMHFRVKAVGRSYELPCRKSSPAPQSPGSPIAAPTLHSPLSPFSPSSPLFPDGFMHPLWPLKWQELVPAVWISVFSLTSNPGMDVSNDEALKNEINSLKAALWEPYHVRFAVLIIGHASVAQASNIDDRISSLRKATKLDAKTGLFYAHPDLSPDDLAAFASSVLAAVRPAAQEFYRDLTKHTRKKKDRGTYSSLTTASESPIAPATSRSGWVTRYEYKLGVYAEFRFEMDAASRHFYAALDALFDSDGVFETLSNWSPRWNEVRILADTIAARQMRCLLANGLPLAATRFWVKYRDTTYYVLNRRGKGTANYGWKAWEARWAKIMAELVQASSGFAIDLVVRKTLEGISPIKAQVYIEVGRDQPVEETFKPWEILHHAGYWFAYSAELSCLRRSLAYSMPEEDRIPPGQSPATQVVRRHETYDTYLVPEPHMEYPISDIIGFDHGREIAETLQAALSEFYQRGQTRTVHALKLKLVKELENASAHEDSLKLMESLWKDQTWRYARWLNLERELASTFYSTAKSGNDPVARLMALCELLGFEPIGGLSYDFASEISSSSSSEAENSRPHTLQLKHDDLEFFFDVSFTFGPGEAHASETLYAQVGVVSRLNVQADSVTMTSLRIDFEGSITTLLLVNKGSDGSVLRTSASNLLQGVDLVESDEQLTQSSVCSLTGVADLTIRPGQNKVFNLILTPREAGIIKAMKAEIIFETRALRVSCIKDLQNESTLADWWIGQADNPRKRTTIRNPSQVIVHPKLPKVRIRFSSLQTSYYIGEIIVAEVDVLNEEAVAVDVILDVRVPGQDDFSLSVYSPGQASTAQPPPAVEAATSTLKLRTIDSSAVEKLVIRMQTPSAASNIVLQVKATYEMESPLTTTSSADITVLNPFDAQYSITPDLHPQSWPSFFHLDAIASSESLAQTADLQALNLITNRWNLKVELHSRALEKLHIKKMELELVNVSDKAVCYIHRNSNDRTPVVVTPKARYENVFSLDTKRMELEDLHTTTVEALLKVHWSREAQDRVESIVTPLSTPRLTLPSSEPRVLATMSTLENASPLLIDLILENPSMHFLSFNVSMEPGESFVFSGPKAVTKHLVPVSRHIIRYTILPLERDKFLLLHFKVLDIHFNKSLNINPSGDMRADPAGLLVWTGPSDIPSATGR